MFRMFGYDPAKGLPPNDAVLSLVHSDDRQASREAVAQLFERGRALDIQYRYVRPDGQQRIIRHIGGPLYENGTITRFVGACLDITEQEIATQELRRSEAILSQAQRVARVGVFVYKSPDIPEYWSPLSYEIFGLDPAKGPPPNLAEYMLCVHPDDRERVMQETNVIMAHGQLFEYKYRIVRPDGAVRVLREVGTPIYENGTVIRYIGAWMDVTEQEQVTERLRRSEFYLSEGQRLTRTGSWSFTPDGRFNYWSAEAFVNFGFDPSKGIPTIAEMLTVVHPDDRDLINKTAETMITEGVGCDFKYRIIHPERGVRIMHSIGYANSRDKMALQFVGTTLDITEQEQQLDELKRSELYLAEGQRLASMGSWAFNPSGYYDYWSKELFRVYGFDAREGAPTLEQYLAAVHPEDREFMSETIQRMHAEGSGCDVTKRIVRPNGEVRYIRCVGVPVLNKGILKSIFGTAIDVTEQEHLTQELQRREAYLAEAQKLSRTGSFGWNVASGEIFWSEETFRIFEYDGAVKPSLELVLQRTHPDDRAVVRQFLERVTDDGNDWDFEHRLLTPDGSTKYLHSVARAAKNALGALEFVGAVMDITATRRADEELHQTRTQLTHFARLTTLGELTASIAHEVNQPLSGVINSANAGVRWLDSQPPDIHRARQSIDRIIRDAGRASEVVARVRDLAKKTPPRKGWLNINETVEEIISLTRQEVRKNHVWLKTQLSDDVPPILADRIQLQQVILNLIINAVEALTAVPDAERVLQITTTAGPSGDVSLTVGDSGPGLDQEKLEEIFGAFYTTKPDGMGMGLAVSRSIIEAHGGRLWANKNEPRGAIFQFTLPKDQGENL
jgi:PAS domain S-box-containing protein